VHAVPPRRPWQIPVASDALVAGALVHGRAVALEAAGPRRNGLPDAEVEARRERLHAAVVARAGAQPEALGRLEALESAAPDVSWTRWQVPLALVGADDDPAVIALALDVWDALGSNAYALAHQDRPRTDRGAVEGRAWLSWGVAGPVLLAVGSVEAASRGSAWWVAFAAGAVAWPVLVWRAFRSSYRRREADARKELPHF